MPTTSDGIVYPDVNSTYPEANWWVAMANSLSGKIASSEAGEQRAINAAVSAEAAAALAEAATDGIEEIRDETVQARDDAVAAVQSVDDALDQVNASAAAAEAAQQAAEDAAALVDAPAGEVMDTYFGAIDGDLGHLYIPGAVSATPPPSPYVGQYWVDPSDDSLLTPAITEVASRWLAGSGHPEGAVTAALGTRYTDTAAVGGAVEWIKTTTAGNTGWRVAYGDTGWRDVSALMSGVGSGELLLRRIGGVAHLDFNGITPTTLSNGGTIYQLPTGFRPGSNVNWSQSVSLPNPASFRSAFVTTGGPFGIWAPSTTDAYSGFQSWPTDRTWPTTLPGTAV